MYNMEYRRKTTKCTMSDCVIVLYGITFWLERRMFAPLHFSQMNLLYSVT